MTPTFETKNPDFKTSIEEKLKKQFFMKHLGIRLSVIEKAYVEAEVVFEDFLKQQNSFLHGGVTATLNDIVAGFAAFTLVAPDEGVVTADLRISYLLPGDAPKYKAKGWVIKAGNMLHFCESEVWGVFENRELLIAKSSSTMAVVKLANLKK